VLAEEAAAPRFSLLQALLISWALSALAFALTSWLLPGLDVSGGIWGYLVVAAIFGLVNAVLGTVIHALTVPLALITLGLFSLLVNAALLEITDALSDHLSIDDFGTAFWAALILAVISVLLQLVARLLFDPARLSR
jgi:putative membrane protein